MASPERHPRPSRIRAFVPTSRRRFRFPAPFNTEAYRLTIPDDCGGKDCLEQEGYSFWRNINAHAGQPVVRVFVALEDTTYVTLITVDKATGAVTKQGSIFGKPSQDRPISYARGAGWFWSAVDPDLLYGYATSQMIAKNVASGTETVVFDLASSGARKAHGAGSDVRVWAAIASNDGQSWAMTVKKAVDPWNDLGCAIYHAPTDAWHFMPGPMGDCFVDKGGAYWVAGVAGATSGNDQLLGTVNPWSVGETLTDPDGAPGHLDLGWGFLLGEDNFAPLGQTLRLWDLSRPLKAPGQGRVVHTMVGWLSDGYTQPTWSMAKTATLDTVGSQIACSTSTAGPAARGAGRARARNRLLPARRFSAHARRRADHDRHDRARRRQGVLPGAEGQPRRHGRVPTSGRPTWAATGSMRSWSASRLHLLR